MYDGKERLSRRTDGIDKRYRRWYREEDGNDRIIHWWWHDKCIVAQVGLRYREVGDHLMMPLRVDLIWLLRGSWHRDDGQLKISKIETDEIGWLSEVSTTFQKRETWTWKDTWTWKKTWFLWQKWANYWEKIPCHSFIDQSRTYHWWPPISLDIHKRRVKGNHRTSIEHKKTK